MASVDAAFYSSMQASVEQHPQVMKGLQHQRQIHFDRCTRAEAAEDRYRQLMQRFDTLKSKSHRFLVLQRKELDEQVEAYKQALESNLGQMVAFISHGTEPNS